MKILMQNKAFQLICCIAFFGFLAFTTKYRPFDSWEIQAKPYVLLQGWINSTLVAWMGVNMASLALLGLGVLCLLLGLRRNQSQGNPYSGAEAAETRRSSIAHGQRGGFGKRGS